MQFELQAVNKYVDLILLLVFYIFLKIIDYQSSKSLQDHDFDVILCRRIITTASF